MVISSETIVHDVTEFLVSLIDNNVTDPILARRSGNSKFVLSSYPSRITEYPFVSVIVESPDTQEKFIGTQTQRVTITAEIRVWARNVKERDELSDEIYNTLRIKQTAAGGSVSENLSDMEYTHIGDINEENVRSRLVEIQYTYYAG